MILNQPLLYSKGWLEKKKVWPSVALNPKPCLCREVKFARELTPIGVTKLLITYKFFQPGQKANSSCYLMKVLATVTNVDLCKGCLSIKRQCHERKK